MKKYKETELSKIIEPNNGYDLIYGRNQDEIIENIESIYTKKMNCVIFSYYLKYNYLFK